MSTFRLKKLDKFKSISYDFVANIGDTCDKIN